MLRLVNYNRDELVSLVIMQLRNWYTINDTEILSINTIMDSVLEKVEVCFDKIANKYYYSNELEGAILNPLHNGQYTFFLYLLSRQLFLQGESTLCDKIYNLIKIFSSCDLFYQVNMPDIFFFDHPMGSVIGRAEYSDYFSFSQGCTVGNNKGVYPKFGTHVHLLSNSKVIGNCNIGDYVIVSANTYIKDIDIPSYSLVFGNSPNITVKPITLDQYKQYTGSIFK